MTEKAAPLSSLAVIPSQTSLPPNVGSPVLPNEQSAQSDGADEEPYTIKCICAFTDDDGNTIYCEKCDTWQHIDCFYPNNRDEAIREDFAHACAECNPRPLDRKKAKERTFGLTQPIVSDASERKTKRPPTKSHKKKPRPVETLNGTNGHHGASETGKQGSPTENSQPKRSKSHKASQSISSQGPKRSPSHANPKTGSLPNPGVLPDLPEDFHIHTYTPRFRSLYDEEAFTETQNNAFSNLQVPSALARWLREPETMKEEVGATASEVFRVMKPDLESKKAKLVVENASQKVAATSGTDQIRWRFLKSTSQVEKDAPLMELNGMVDFQAAYCAQADNHWSDLTVPLPFVFFHPDLPLCIDTRREGSLARYVRRSCKPNAQIDTFLSGPDYHFWLVSDQSIPPNEPITVPWDPRFDKHRGPRWLHLLDLNDDEQSPNEPEMQLEEYNTIAEWIDRILSEHGGCACGLGNECAFARFHRKWLYLKDKVDTAHGPKAKKARKNRNRTISPTSTGHTTNSRAASEGHNEDDADNDGASQSESSRSKAPSRERTPARQGSLDKPGILTELTDREKRKVAMAEDHFRRMDEKQPPRKKKRVSDGANASEKPKHKSRNGSIAPPGQYVDAGTSRRTSGSPASLRSPNAPNAAKLPNSRKGSSSKQKRQIPAGPKVTYCDAGVQTDAVDGAWYNVTPPPMRPRKRVISLSRRLLNNKHRMQAEEELRQSQVSSMPTPVSSTAMEIDSPDESKPPKTAANEVNESPKASPSTDTHMSDVVAEGAVVATAANATEEPVKLMMPDLRMQMPPVPAFDNTTPTAPNTTTPLSAASSTAHSPFASASLGNSYANGLVAPSPVKKKLSLSDYTKSRKNKAAGHMNGGVVTVKPSVEEIKIEADAEITTAAPKSEEGSTKTTMTTANGV